MSDSIVEQIGDEFGVTVRYTPHDVYVEFFAAEVLGVEDGGKLLYWRKGSDSSTDPTYNLNDAERYFDGSVKWDGCSHLAFGDENGYLHLCGSEDIVKLGDAVKVIYERCGELMKERGAKLLEGEFETA